MGPSRRETKRNKKKELRSQEKLREERRHPPSPQLCAPDSPGALCSPREEHTTWTRARQCPRAEAYLVQAGTQTPPHRPITDWEYRNTKACKRAHGRGRSASSEASCEEPIFSSFSDRSRHPDRLDGHAHRKHDSTSPLYHCDAYQVGEVRSFRMQDGVFLKPLFKSWSRKTLDKSAVSLIPFSRCGRVFAKSCDKRQIVIEPSTIRHLNPCSRTTHSPNACSLATLQTVGEQIYRIFDTILSLRSLLVGSEVASSLHCFGKLLDEADALGTTVGAHLQHCRGWIHIVPLAPVRPISWWRHTVPQRIVSTKRRLPGTPSGRSVCAMGS